MTIKQLRYFLSVCHTQNLTKSAQELYVSQPTLSVSMKELEKEVGVTLFNKKGTHLFLTEAGARLKQEAEGVLHRYERMEEMIKSGDLAQDYIRFGFSTIVGNSTAPMICKQFLADHPDTKLQATEDFGRNLLFQLENGQLDVVLTGGNYYTNPKWADKFDTYDVNASTLVYCVSPVNRLAAQGSVSLEDIARYPIILLNHNFPIAQTVEENFEQRGLKLNVLFRTSQMFTIEQFIATGVAGGFLPEEACIGNNRVTPLHCEGLESFKFYSVKLYWNKGTGQKGSIIRDFVKSAQKVYH